MVLKHISQASGVSHTATVTDSILDNTCGATSAIPSPRLGFDDGGTIAYNIGNLAAGKSKTVKVTYERN
jgi:hypothetical protein